MACSAGRLRSAFPQERKTAYKHPTMPCTVRRPIWRRYVLFPDMLRLALSWRTSSLRPLDQLEVCRTVCRIHVVRDHGPLWQSGFKDGMVTVADRDDAADLGADWCELTEDDRAYRSLNLLSAVCVDWGVAHWKRSRRSSRAYRAAPAPQMHGRDSLLVSNGEFDQADRCGTRCPGLLEPPSRR